MGGLAHLVPLYELEKGPPLGGQFTEAVPLPSGWHSMVPGLGFSPIHQLTSTFVQGIHSTHTHAHNPGTRPCMCAFHNTPRVEKQQVPGVSLQDAWGRFSGSCAMNWSEGWGGQSPPKAERTMSQRDQFSNMLVVVFKE